MCLLHIQNHRIIRVGKGLLRSSCPNPCRDRVTWSKGHSNTTRYVLNVSGGGHSLTSLGSPGQCSATLNTPYVEVKVLLVYLCFIYKARQLTGIHEMCSMLSVYSKLPWRAIVECITFHTNLCFAPNWGVLGDSLRSTSFFPTINDNTVPTLWVNPGQQLRPMLPPIHFCSVGWERELYRKRSKNVGWVKDGLISEANQYRQAKQNKECIYCFPSTGIPLAISRKAGHSYLGRLMV